MTDPVPLSAIDWSALSPADPVTEMALVAKFTDFGVIVTDDRARALWVNQGFERLTGYSLDEVRGTVPGHLLQGPDTDPETVAYMRSKIAAGEGFNADVLNYRKDGSSYWINIEVRPILDETGRAQRFIAIEWDVTAKREADERVRRAREDAEAFAEALAYSRQQLEMIIHGADLGEWIWDIDTQEISVNHEWLEALGVTIEPTGSLETILTHVHASHRERIVHAGHDLAENDQIDIEFQLVDGNRPVWLLARGRAVAFDEQGRPQRLMGTLLDISERKHIEDQLRSERELMSNILATIPHAVYWKDTDGRYLGCNETFAASVGLSTPDAVIGLSDADIFPIEVAADRHRIDQEVLLSGRPFFDTEETSVSADGRRRSLLASRVPIRDHTDQVSGVLGVFTDVSAMKDLESKLAAATRLEAIGQLAAGIAHEINTPMQYIGDNIQFLRKAFDRLETIAADLSAFSSTPDDALPGAVADLLTRAETLKLDFLRSRIPRSIDQALEGVEAVSRIVRAMKDFSNPGTELMQPVDLNEAIATTLTVCRNEWKYVAEIETDLDPSLPTIPALPGELNQVLLNIVVNAAHAIEGSHDQGAMGTITVRTRSTDDHVMVSIGDDGGGIPAAIRDKIFEPFFTTKPVGKGSGQGLAITHQIVVTRHGGSIEVDSVEGEGTTFTVRLPRHTAVAEVA